jgi:hypothetical protein
MTIKFSPAILVVAIVLSAASQASAKQALVEINTTVKGFISSCQKAGGTASGGDGVVSCNSGNKNTSCSVSNGRTDACVQTTPGRQNPDKDSRSSAGNDSTGNGNVGNGGGSKNDSASSSGNASGPSSASGNDGNTIK